MKEVLDGLSEDARDLVALALDLGLSADDLRKSGYVYFEAAHWLSCESRKTDGSQKIILIGKQVDSAKSFDFIDTVGYDEDSLTGDQQ